MEEKNIKRKGKIVTITSILTQENVKDTIERLVKQSHDITDLICIYRDREGAIGWKCTDDSAMERIVAMIEQTKICLLTSDYEDEGGKE